MNSTRRLPTLRRHRTRGAVLMLAMWALFVLAAAILVWIQFVRQTLLVGSEQELSTEALASAHGGVALASHPLVTKQTPLLMMGANQDPGFEVRMISEGSKLNINTLLPGDDPRKHDIFKKWLEYRGVPFDQRDRIVDCLIDYIDADNLKRANGEEDTQTYHPPNRGTFTSVDEIEKVINMEALVNSPGWKDDLTINSGGSIDLTSAEKHILMLLPGLSEPGVDSFLQFRRGADQVDGTLDDPVIEKLDQVQAFLGMNKTQFNALGGLVSVRDNNWRIISKGWSGKVIRQVEVVVRKGGSNPQIIDWRE